MQFVKGVGPFRATLFARLGVHTVRDLLEYYPFRFEFHPQSVPIDGLEEGEVASIVGEVRRFRVHGTGNAARVTATIVDGTGVCRVQWFNSGYLADKIEDGTAVRLTGKVEVRGSTAAMTNPTTQVPEEDDPFAADVDQLLPVYSATAQLKSSEIAKAIRAVLDSGTAQMAEWLPAALLKQHQFPPRGTCVKRMHAPVRQPDVDAARARLAYEELLLYQLALQLGRKHLRRESAIPLESTPEIDRRIRARFPFALTPGQSNAIGEIIHDLAQSAPMQRLLQADVGAGKTVVALYAALVAVANGKQVAFLAPTEVLARQHFDKIAAYLSGSRVRLELLTGAIRGQSRDRILSQLARGQLDLVVGTHALIGKGVQFNELALVVVDEQHKFGVEQRKALRGKGVQPHMLALTATPIPRSLAMTLLGDLDVTVFHDPPPNRQAVTTRIVPEGRDREAWDFVRRRLDADEQAYIVYPIIDESEAVNALAARTDMEKLASGPLSGYPVGLLHGKLASAERLGVLERFRRGDVRVLVSTTIIEVGVDVPAATVMVIRSAERFGLSQLHQLRGRVGRGDRKSYCLLMQTSPSEVSRQRLSIVCDSSDGFRIAEEDLRLRGPGELLGTRQHGMPDFKVADLAGDLRWVEQARDDAGALVRHDPRLTRPDHAALRRELTRLYGQRVRHLLAG